MMKHKRLQSGVAGSPVCHSRSPLIHHYWLQQYGIPGSYEKFEIPPCQLGEFIHRLKIKEFCGMNLTIPHKEAVFPYLDHIDEECRAIGAVNTLFIQDGIVTGLNTDIFGFTQNLYEQAGEIVSNSPQNLPHNHAVILGAGGVARACLSALCKIGYDSVAISNRTSERSQSLRSDFRHLPIHISLLDWQHRSEGLKEADLLINATSLGMQGCPPLEIALDRLAPHAIIYDLVYVPLETRLLQDAKKRGFQTIDGLGMLIHQARPAFQTWFGVLPEATQELRFLLEQNIQLAPA